MSRVNTQTQHAPTTVNSFTLTVGFQQLFPAQNIQILNCWFDTRLIHAFRDFTGFVQCTFETCVKTLSPVPMQLNWIARLVITHRDETQ